MAYGVIYHTLLIVVGAAMAVGSMFGWALEPSTAPDSDFDPPSDSESSKEVAAPCLTRRSPIPAPSPTDDAARRRRRSSTTIVDDVIADVAHDGADDDVLDHIGHAHHTSTGLSNTKLAMWLFLGSECLLFGGLIATYMLYRNRQGDAIGPDQLWDIPFTSASSFCLLMSSLTMVLAVSAAKRKDDRNTRLWLIATASLGGLFVAGQVYEFTTFYREGLGYTTSLFGSSFYTLTGFHGVHVSVGIIMLMALMFMLLRNRVSGDKAETVEMIGLYWHFVDIVWIIIFTLVYLIPA